MKKTIITLLFVQLVFGQIPEGKKVISHLYLYDLATRKSILLQTENRHFEAPNWSPDGTYLLINSGGKIEKYSLEGKPLAFIDTQELQKCNNDHGISFDGKTLFFSSGKNEIEEHTSFIYQMPLTGGIPEQITKLSPSYWHGVSPDGKDIVYCAAREGNYDVYKMNVDQKKEIRLTSAAGLDDGPEYAPDGSYVYFNSFRTGIMQLWRMTPDGKNKEQLTFDDYSDWFPHIAPDNQKLVFISYVEDQKQSHPFGKSVKLRLMNLKTKEVSDLTPEFYGGQGTLNVNSWNPDSTQFTYVAYSLEEL